MVQLEKAVAKSLDFILELPSISKIYIGLLGRPF